MISSDLAGLWYLTRLDADERTVPQHRVVIKFDRAGDELRGDVVTPIGDIPLATLTFDGTRLSFQLQRPTDTGFETLTLMPYPLVLEAVAEKFEGRWIWMKNEVQSFGPRLKLWRAHEPDRGPRSEDRP